MRNERQALAVTLGLLLLVGCTLLLRELAGVWLAFAVSCGVILGGYATPGLARELTVRRYAGDSAGPREQPGGDGRPLTSNGLIRSRSGR
ncbi:hypothetical protein [Streptomyces sp. CB02923]|uniref:hypothetical protein n=1 Tax=Streptomyces sp. CB02923 TaxID=1718985 RepID=UPI00190087F6|nr:hypothetical protein [Streptomyces sp. CB02923]